MVTPVPDPHSNQPARSVFAIELHGDAVSASTWSLSAPHEVLSEREHETHKLACGSSGLDQGALATLSQRLGDALQHNRTPLLLVSGHPLYQLCLMEALQSQNLASRVCTVSCVASQHRPVLWRDYPFLHGLVVDAPPTAAENLRWQRFFGNDLGQRVIEIQPFHAQTQLDRETIANRIHNNAQHSAQGLRCSLIALEADAWMALGIFAFTVWAQGRFSSCSNCGAYSVDRFYPHMARFEARNACLYCGALSLQRAQALPDAQLSVFLNEDVEASPHPGVLAEWLGVVSQLEVQTLSSEADFRTIVQLYSQADISILLNDPAYPDVRLPAARASNTTLVTNHGNDGMSAVAACHSWDASGQVTAYTSIPALLRALIDAQNGGQTEHHQPAIDNAMTTDQWFALIDHFERLPARRLRLRRPAAKRMR